MHVDEDALVAALDRLDPSDRAALTAGESGWSTLGAPAAGLTAMLVGDGPLGLVSATFDERETALLLPSGIALGATWDPEVVRSVALAQASEALRRDYAAIYTPNLNLARTGRSGRTFEMYSEDPYLAGSLGAAYVDGVQSLGVASCPKHLVANDTETERQRMNAVVDDVSLREVYLRPFEMALRDAGAWMVMAAYNQLNGIPCTANADLLRIVKEEWGWDGVVVSDYFALKDTLGPALAGLDLEMPGPAIFLGDRLGDAVAAGDVLQSVVDDKVLRLLRLAARVGALKGTERQASAPEQHVSAEDAPQVLAAAAAASFTLVKNADNLLPLEPGRLKKLAVIGPNAARPTFQGATFGRVRPAEAILTPDAAIRETFGGTCEVVAEPGIARTRPEPFGEFPVTTPDGRPGVLLEHFRDGPQPVLTEVRADSSFIWFGFVPGVGSTMEPGRLRLTTVFTPELSGPYLFGGGGSGETSVSVEGVSVSTKPAPAPGDIMGQVARAEMATGTVELTAGVPVTVVVDMETSGARVQALTVGCLPPQEPGTLERAVQAAADADAVVLVVGDVLETSRESKDIENSELPPEQLELIHRVAAVNKRTVVVVNSGRPIDVSWADEVAAVMFIWLAGQSFGPALADVLSGAAEPAGRLPVTITRRDEDRSTWNERLDENLSLDYARTEPTGYRHLQRTGVAPRFAFGAGLGYTTWEHRDAHVETSGRRGARQAVVTTTVLNTGPRAGREVVQVYVRAPGEQDARLAGFAGAHVEPGASVEVSVVLDERAFARWDVGSSSWVVAPGRHDVLVGRSSVDLPHALSVEM